MEDNERYSAANKKLNAKKNGIKAVPASDTPQKPKRRGRPPGQPATIIRRPKKIDRRVIVDVTECPNNENHTLSDKSDEYGQVVEVVNISTEVVEFRHQRRYCCGCKTLVHAEIPGVPRYARKCVNNSAIVAVPNMAGLSHGKTAKFSTEVLKSKVSRSWSYRNKVAVSKQMAGGRDMIQQEILKEPYIHS